VNKSVRIIGVPLDLGQDRRGVDMGPAAVRVAGLYPRLQALGYAVEDVGNVAVAFPEHLEAGDPHAKYLAEIAASCQRQAAWVRQTLEAGALPLVLGGDHSIAMGTVGGVSAHYRDRGENIGLIWLDAHGDVNTPATSPSGNIHGMGLACLLGQGPDALTGLLGFQPKVAPGNVALVGVHELDPGERQLLRALDVNVFTMREIDERGIGPVMSDALQRVTEGTAGYCASLDLDFIDAAFAPGVGTPVRGGATYREGHLAMEMIADSERLLSLEAVEVNPVLDERNRTAELAVELILSGLGKKIL
jgi:arginase